MCETLPETAHLRWIDSVNRADLDALDQLYEADASFVVRPCQVVTGLAAIRQANVDLLALRPQATLKVQLVVRSGDVALLISRWQLTGTDANGQPVEVGGQTSDVVRQQPDGTWKFVIDNPWGDAAAST